MASAFELKIVTPEGPAFTGQVQSLRLPGVDGDFGILGRHAPLLSALQAGVVEVVDGSGQKNVYAVGDGFVEVGGGHVSLLTDFVNLAGEVDVERAEKARERAKERLRQTGTELDLPRAEAALGRAIARLSARSRS